MVVFSHTAISQMCGLNAYWYKARFQTAEEKSLPWKYTDQRMKTEQTCDGFYPVAAADASYDDDLEVKLWCQTSLINQST